MTPAATLLAARPYGGYALIMADPPWAFAVRGANGEAKAPQAHYACMDLAAIAALPVATLAADDALLCLWATNPMLPHALKVMAAWGFGFRTSGHWVKRGATGKLAFGTGYILRCAGEPFLIGTRGKPKVGSRAVRSVIEAPRREHSRKPDAAYAAAEALMADPTKPRLDLFARQSRPGWTAWGDESAKFDATGPANDRANDRAAAAHPSRPDAAAPARRTPAPGGASLTLDQPEAA